MVSKQLVQKTKIKQMGIKSRFFIRVLPPDKIGPFLVNIIRSSLSLANYKTITVISFAVEKERGEQICQFSKFIVMVFIIGYHCTYFKQVQTTSNCLIRTVRMFPQYQFICRRRSGFYEKQKRDTIKMVPRFCFILVMLAQNRKKC